HLEYVTLKDAASGATGCGSGSPNFVMRISDSALVMEHSQVVGGNSYRKLLLENSSAVLDDLTLSQSLSANNLATYQTIGIEIKSGSPTVKNSSISGMYTGIFATSGTQGASTPTIMANTLNNNTYPIKLSNSFGTLTGNSAADNIYNGIWFDAVLSAGTVTMAADGIPYILSSLTVNSGASFGFGAGSVVKFATGGGLITVNGSFNATGTPSNPIVFTSLGDNSVGGTTYGVGAANVWARLLFNSGSAGTFSHTTIKNGGANLSDYFGALYVNGGGTVSLDHATIQNSTKSGVYSFGGSVTGSGVTFTGNQYSLFTRTGSCPVLTDSVFSDTTLNHPYAIQCSY
ncbi:MAG: phage tail tape measure protein, partial [Candidatus Wildermuthbacteria bacterium]|nr:phage tail tape measure protein [Candidatus Wildermuthbacteria bacterium]